MIEAPDFLPSGDFIMVRASIVALGLALLVSQANAAEPVRIYYIGNSVTDTVRYPKLAELAKTRDITIEWGRHMIPGAPLEWLYTHPDDGFTERPYGGWKQALGEHRWDIVSLQPFDRMLYSKEKKGTDEDHGDVPLIVKLARMAAEKNPEVQIYVYSRWPRMTSGGKGLKFDKNDYDPSKPGGGIDLSKIDDFAERWNAKYTGGYDGTNETRDYFEQVLSEVRSQADFLKRPPLLIPVGDVMADLHAQMKAGKVAGHQSIYELYRDGIHLNEAGSYLVGCTFFATFLKQSPAGLPTEPYGTIEPELAKTIQETVWRVVKEHPHAGLARTTP
jgi:hypothetical protein